MKKMYSVRYKFGRGKDSVYKAIVLTETKEKAIKSFMAHYAIDDNDAYKISAYEVIDNFYSF